MVSVLNMDLWVLRRDYEPSGSAAGKDATRVSTGLTLGPLQRLIKSVLLGPVASGLGRWSVDHCAALPEAQSTQTPTAGARRQHQAWAFATESCFEFSSQGLCAVLELLAGFVESCLFQMCVYGGGRGVELSSPRNPSHLPTS